MQDTMISKMKHYQYEIHRDRDKKATERMEISVPSSTYLGPTGVLL